MAVFLSNDHQFIVIANGRKEARDIELLLLAKSIPHQLEFGFASKRFIIPLAFEETARNEIKLFLDENKSWPPKINLPIKRSLQISIFHFIVILWLSYFHWQTNGNPLFPKWIDQGGLSAELVLGGEWQRTLTSMTLHLDDSHFLSNLVGLVFFAIGVDQFIGGGFAWLLIVVSGALGNYANAFFYQTAHQAVGASTAVFSAVGLLGALGVKHYFCQQEVKRRFFIPLIGALGLFAMLGTNPQSDVMAHLFGLISGLGVGVVFLPFSNALLIKKPIVQVAAFCICVALIFYAWQFQLGRL